jgi:hypothetical protein
MKPAQSGFLCVGKLIINGGMDTLTGMPVFPDRHDVAHQATNYPEPSRPPYLSPDFY